MKHIVSQDRDRIYEYTGAECLHIEPVYNGGIPIAVNLLLDGKQLGTFGSADESVREIGRIVSSKEEIVAVDGYSQGGFAEW